VKTIRIAASSTGGEILIQVQGGSVSHRHARVALACLAATIVLGTTSAAGAEAPRDRSESSQRNGLRVAALAGVGFPRPFAVEGLIGIHRALAIGLEYSFLPQTKIYGIDTSFAAIAGTCGSFRFETHSFVGIRGGRQHLRGAATIAVPPYGTFDESIDVDSWFINPRAGFSGCGIGARHRGRPRCADPARLEPIEHAAGKPSRRSARDSVTSVTSTFSTNVIPTFDLLRLGMAL